MGINKISNSIPGMLASAGTITVVADAIQRHNVPFAVVDPVLTLRYQP
jgi:hydroxymethylpyrimidine/phosphomethylpyrimidine kinase